MTGGGSAATVGSSSAPADDEAAEAKEEPVKEQSPAVRPKMEVSTPQKVGEIIRHRKLVSFKFTAIYMFRISALAVLFKKRLVSFP